MIKAGFSPLAISLQLNVVTDFQKSASGSTSPWRMAPRLECEKCIPVSSLPFLLCRTVTETALVKCIVNKEGTVVTGQPFNTFFFACYSDRQMCTVWSYHITASHPQVGASVRQNWRCFGWLLYSMRVHLINPLKVSADCKVLDCC